MRMGPVLCHWAGVAHGPPPRKRAEGHTPSSHAVPRRLAGLGAKGAGDGGAAPASGARVARGALESVLVGGGQGGAGPEPICARCTKEQHGGPNTRSPCATPCANPCATAGPCATPCASPRGTLCDSPCPGTTGNFSARRNATLHWATCSSTHQSADRTRLYTCAARPGGRHTARRGLARRPCRRCSR